MAAIEFNNVHKAYDSLPVLRGLGMRIETGEIYGLLGPNGSGKSTIMHLVLGFLRPQQGYVRVLGTNDLGRNSGRIGYLPERLRFHLRFSAREYLRALGAFNDMREPALSRRVDDELAAVGLSAAANRQLGTFSRGMLQRVGIAQALLHHPELLLIDEPTGGLDPSGQRDMVELLGQLRERGCTVLLTTHYLEEIDQICDRVGILYNGRIAAEAPLASLRAPSRNVVIRVNTMPLMLIDRLLRLSNAVRVDGNIVSLAPNTPELQARVLQALLDANVGILALAPQVTLLADLYTRVTHGEQVAPPAQAEERAATPPDSLFAPPDHPDATRQQGEQRGTGDTLLRDLLRREEHDS